MSIDDFATYGLEPGQRALVWDFETRQYVSILKPPQPTLAAYVMALATGAIAHGISAIAVIGGLRA